MPITMTLVSISLMLLAYEKQRWMWLGSDSPGPTPATVLAFIANGPAFAHLPYLDKLIPETLYRLSGYQGERLFGIALMWYLIGRAIDRKRQGKNLSVTHPRVALALFGSLLALSLFMLIVLWAPLTSDFQVEVRVLKNLPMTSRESIYVAVGMWMTGFSAYFLKRSLEAVKAVRQRSSDPEKCR